MVSGSSEKMPQSVREVLPLTCLALVSHLPLSLTHGLSLTAPPRHTALSLSHSPRGLLACVGGYATHV